MNQETDRKLEQLRLKAAGEEQRLKADLIELEIKLQTAEAARNELQNEINDLDNKLAQAYDSLRKSDNLGH